jgi:hypothetical protein
MISAWPVICPPRNEYVATHWASARADRPDHQRDERHCRPQHH